MVAQPDWLAIHSNGVCQDQALCKFHDYFLSKIGSDTLIVFADCVNTSKVIWQKLFNHKQSANRLLQPISTWIVLKDIFLLFPLQKNSSEMKVHPINQNFPSIQRKNEGGGSQQNKSYCLFSCEFCIYKRKHRKNCECCPGHYLIVNHYSSI